jgi:hypothetical protein
MMLAACWQAAAAALGLLPWRTTHYQQCSGCKCFVSLVVMHAVPCGAVLVMVHVKEQLCSVVAIVHQPIYDMLHAAALLCRLRCFALQG